MNQSEGASPAWMREAAEEIRQCCLQQSGYLNATLTAEIIANHAPTRQATWEAGRDDAIKIVAHEFPSITLLAKIRALKYSGPSGAQDAPTPRCAFCNMPIKYPRQV